MFRPAVRARRPSFPAALLFAAAAAACGGCDNGPERFPTAPAGGTVLCGGVPLDGGRVVFMPLPVDGQVNVGKQARGFVSAEGGFDLSTYAEGDGAVIGEHRVFVEAVDGGNLPDCDGRVAETYTITADGPNLFTIELNARPAGEAGGGDEDEDEED